MKSRGKQLVKAKDIYLYMKDPFLVYCDYHVEPKYKEQITKFQDVLFKRGNKHEDFIVEDKYPDAVHVRFETETEGFRLALENMDDGADALDNMPLFLLPEGLMGRPDLMVKKKGRSIFGDYHYVVKEIKLAKNIKEYHVLQAAFYNYILGRIQKFTPERFYLINRDGEEKSYDYKDYKNKLRDVIRDVREVIKGKEVSPTYGHVDWPWGDYADELAIKQHDVSLVSGIGLSVKRKLNSLGIKTYEDLAKANIEQLIILDRISDVMAKRFIRNAKALDQKKEIVFGKIKLPERKIEVFFDLEGTDDGEDFDQMDYLIGCLERKNGKEKYIPFISHSIEGEEQMFKEFLDYMKTLDDFVLYHWHQYERIHIKKMMKKYGCPKNLKEKILDNMIDLYKISVDNVAFPTYGNSLKDIAPYLGFKWRHKEVDAMESIAMFLEFIETKDNKILQLIQDYNEDDVIATRVVKDYLAKLMT